jgi:hypothetical protein
VAEEAVEIVLPPTRNEPFAIPKPSKKIKKLKHMFEDDEKIL